MPDPLLDDLVSGDAGRIHSAVWAIIRARDPVVLDPLASALAEIRSATADVDLGGIVFPNRASLAFALRKLEHHRDRAGCLCALYPGLLLIDPEREAEAGHVRILGVTKIQDRWIDSYSCECTACGARFEVKEGESHYTWWQWTPRTVGA